ncbi:Angiopoietin-related protein 1,Ficolin-1-A,Angiopoietin-1,Fibrinogen C domain-containing protein 1,Ryncolin-1,Tenascin-N,Angiopoietin-related protein 7,Ficolin-3,Fibrinogen C domain-containing protein 1-B,Fibroleukin,Fibrinogen-like protein 1,Ficolin-1,Ficolin-1-B,Angiopoietin-4,Tenascin-R,Ryncolin-2,Techylectin-5B,Fibrinogen C domain-containing protein 1-A,Microfibril-associated glycoprotein 4,Ryncolin-3,Angiopoietin-2,Tenascin-X,Ficolin-2,Tenascin,Angiopoietin-related protein 2,Techylectin-5A,Ryncolin-4|uniref:Fibrinogen C-terminal domain-containing protein n=1 Tax=Mytilus edulis TaxID=6550 RepID=A0A8S3QS62_MYTED|nr:Angiopoietin-related protein 1,Ficolin-1-A,Angiopoietin-1,Fibrinogen C domain-containing protein 1,Ryncolin-1,Tenascin-N,Angiopoietin-related protein 7,Ficolin-3,Fibrinogen C domain-containing protein 1-B,Fibroleukin,Fibrinogen-like protein 1,Ficolin-1,Ficolin-1-B,Angiopoietin-4,Tenascin-R,Ryncolin-2,Techylectin-5B,Fibrinogen C domain-containing protein 1-A,Microfibril-associated glycoprotein 4,Ryncolin-3,Angiopoietin-2,Tenascin-X,Ficolin-2,Tenascin,Angiopoietin-related protein 2,Techylectin-5A,
MFKSQVLLNLSVIIFFVFAEKIQVAEKSVCFHGEKADWILKLLGEKKAHTSCCEKLHNAEKELKTCKENEKKPKPRFDVYCDFETDKGGWTVFQRRINGKTDFYRGWKAYENGFGNLEAEFWLGNRRINKLTAQGKYELRVDISDFNGNKAYAKYSKFAVGDASTNYRLTVAGYSGNAGNSLDYHNGQAFTTMDRDNDPWTSTKYKNNCGTYTHGAWWYKTCAFSNLNGLYMGEGQTSAKAIFWYFFKEKNNLYSLKSSSMMIRRL